jgi:MFS family permease
MIQAKRSFLPRTVILLGLTSFFTDAGSEMIFSLLPAFLIDALHATPTFLGVVEGAADTVSSLLKLWSGRLADRWHVKKPIVLAGYGIASAVRPLMAVVTAPWQVLAVRVTDRIGKGIRSSPRDALIADAAEANVGRAFGFHRAMDHAGAVVGPLLAVALTAAALDVRTIFWIAIIPGAIATALVLLVKEGDRRDKTDTETPSKSAAQPSAPSRLGDPLPSALKRYLAIVFIFSLANSSDAFLLLRARDLGLSAPLLWSVFHVVKLVTSYAFGAASDRVPRVRLIFVGWIVYAATYVGFAFASAAWQVWALFLVYGAYYGLTEPAEKALVKDLAPAEARGRAYGTYNFIVGVTALPSGIATGALWRAFGAKVALGGAAALAMIAAVLLLGARVREVKESKHGP